MIHSRKVCHACVSMPRDFLCGVCDAPAEDVRAVGDEPVACQLRFVKGETPEVISWNEQDEGVHSLYRQPQRQVVLPERKKHKNGNSPMQNAKNSAWNACLDEIERLNK